MKRSDQLTALEELRADMHEQFPAAITRLAQLDRHIDTVAMLIDHIHEEAARAAPGG